LLSKIKISNFVGYIFKTHLISQTMKDTLKTIELLEEHIDRLAESGIYEIERDLLLERLRGLYATALSIEAIAEEELLIGALVGLQEEGIEPTEEPIEERQQPLSNTPACLAKQTTTITRHVQLKPITTAHMSRFRHRRNKCLNITRIRIQKLT
jgi:hypothetical protein